MTWAATAVRMEWRCVKKASSARPRRSSLRLSAGMSQRRSAPVRWAHEGMLIRAVGWQSLAASRRLRMRPCEKASCGSGGKWRSTMVAMSRRWSRGAMRAKGPKVSVWSLRVGPCQASAIEPPRERSSRGSKAAGSERHRNNRPRVKRSAVTEENAETQQRQRRGVESWEGGKDDLPPRTGKLATIEQKDAENRSRRSPSPQCSFSHGLLPQGGSAANLDSARQAYGSHGAARLAGPRSCLRHPYAPSIRRHPGGTPGGDPQFLHVPDLDRPSGGNQHEDSSYETPGLWLPRPRVLQTQNPWHPPNKTCISRMSRKGERMDGQGRKYDCKLRPIVDGKY